jgi:hypothetical protein
MDLVEKPEDVKIVRGQRAHRPAEEGTVLIRRHAVRAALHARRTGYVPEGRVESPGSVRRPSPMAGHSQSMTLVLDVD